MATLVVKAAEKERAGNNVDSKAKPHPLLSSF